MKRTLIAVALLLGMVLGTTLTAVAAMTIPQAHAYVLKWYLNSAADDLYETDYESFILQVRAIDGLNGRLAHTRAVLNAAGDTRYDAWIDSATAKFTQARALLGQSHTLSQSASDTVKALEHYIAGNLNP